MNSKALLFGLNYAHCRQGKLDGCINDVEMMRDYIREKLRIPVIMKTDADSLLDTSKVGILKSLYELAYDSRKENLDFVWIHFSGHGSWVSDKSRDEVDKKDECLVPSDCEQGNMVLDDDINKVLSCFNPRTRILCFFDCCHSGTMADVRYSWPSRYRARWENRGCRTQSRVITISGCMDSQTSADAYNVLGKRQYSGAMTANALRCLRSNPSLCNDVFKFVDELRRCLKKGGFEQVPKLCSTYHLGRYPRMLPQ